MSKWKKFTVKQTSSDTSYADVLGKARSMGEGVHIGVEAISIAPIDGREGDGFDIKFKNDLGEVARQRIFYTYEPKDGEDANFSMRFVRMMSAFAGFSSIVNNPDEEAEGLYLFQNAFMNHVPNSPSFLENLVGLRVNIKIGLPKKGFKVRRKGNDQYYVEDLTTGDTLEYLNEETGGFFPSFDEVKKATQEHNIFLSYLEIQEVLPNAEHTADNQKKLRTAYEKATATESAQEAVISEVPSF